MSVSSVERIKAPSAVSAWYLYPTMYEINTWVWLTDLSQKYGTSLDLPSVPSAEWNAIACHCFDSVWLLGVWERSPGGIGKALTSRGCGGQRFLAFWRALEQLCRCTRLGSLMLRRRNRAGMNRRLAAIRGGFQILWIYSSLLIASRPLIPRNMIAVVITFLFDLLQLFEEDAPTRSISDTP